MTHSGAKLEDQTYGEAADYADAVYLKSDGKWWLADADTATAVKGQVGICVETAGVDAEGTGDVLVLGWVENDAWAWSYGAPIYFSGTAGDLTQTRPETGTVRVAGYPAGTAKILFMPADHVDSTTSESTGTIVLVAGRAYIPAAEDGGAEMADNPVFTANGPAYLPIWFDPDADEAIWFWDTLPADYDGGTLTAMIKYIPETGSNNIRFTVAGRALGDHESPDQAVGTAVAIGDIVTDAGEIHRTSQSTSFVLGGTPEALEEYAIQVVRTATHANDTNTGDIGFLALILTYTKG